MVGAIMALCMIGLWPVAAQGTANAWTRVALNLRSGPDTSYAVITTLPFNTGLVLEARSGDTAWVLGHTEDGSFRGWAAGEYLRYQPGFSPAALPVTDEIAGVTAPPADAPPGETAGPVAAQTSYALNVRAGPGTSYSILGKFPGGVRLVLEARNQDASWVLGHAEDHPVRGWVASLYLQVTGNVNALPYSEELVASGPAPAPPPPAPAPPAADLDEVLGRRLSPPVLQNSYAIFQRGQSLGNSANAFIYIGDSTTTGNQYTLPVFYALARGTYTLGGYGYLQPTITFFQESNSFVASSMTALPGYTSGDVLNAAYANPGLCGVGEMPLECEIRRKKPSIAIIYIGFGDMAFSTIDAYRANLAMIVEILIQRGVIPVLTTLTAPEDMLYESNYIHDYNAMNAFMRELALARQLPLVDLETAAYGLPYQGCSFRDVHLSSQVDGVISFNGNERRYGKDLRALLTLQVLDDLRRNVLQQ